VAEHVGGSIAGFTELMNAKAIELGLVNTNFENPHGLDGRRHYSSARDLLTMTLAASQQAGFTEMVSSVKIAFPTAPDGTVRDAPTTNHLISEYIGATGVKTGYTDRAGLVLVASASRWGRDLIAVVMGAQSAGGHFRDATSLLDFGFNATARMTVLSGNPYPASADGSAPPLSVEATVETLILLNSADFDAVTVAGPSVEPVEVIRSGPDPLPGLRDVLDWTARYWMWLNGAFT
jgi:D-alanyl-D-alanine carboxypeptidase